MRCEQNLSGIHTGTQYTSWLLIAESTELDAILTWTGDPTATITLQGTNAWWALKPDGTDVPDADLNIQDLSTAFSAIPAGSAGGSESNFIDVGPRWVRLKVEGSGGAGGDLTVEWYAKDP